MRYYKLMNEDVFVGIALSDDFRKFQPKHHLLLKSNEEYGCYIYCNNQYYRDRWMIPPNNDVISYIEVDVIEINKSQYDALSSAIEKNEEMRTETELAQEEFPEAKDEKVLSEKRMEEKPDITVGFVKKSKLREMSAACQKAITDGFDVALSNGETRHFSLTLQDQLNLSALSAAVLTGEAEIPYHADDEPCRYYPTEDISAIIGAAERHKRYHTVYYNSLKAYVTSLDDITVISAVMYGTEIPEEFRSEVWSDILKKEGQANGSSDL